MKGFKPKIMPYYFIYNYILNMLTSQISLNNPTEINYAQF